MKLTTNSAKSQSFTNKKALRISGHANDLKLSPGIIVSAPQAQNEGSYDRKSLGNHREGVALSLCLEEQ